MSTGPSTSQPARPGLPTCGLVPVPSGPLAHTAVLVLSAPESGRAGTELAVSTTVMARFAHQRVLTVPASSAVLLLRGGVVVGRTSGSGTGLIPLTLTAGLRRRAQAVPHSVRLNRCHGALPVGRYELIVVLGYRLDSLNATADGAPTRPSQARTFALVSAARPIVVG